MAKYTYNISQDFPVTGFNPDTFVAEIKASAITSPFSHLNATENSVDLWFQDELSFDDKIILDGNTTNPAGGLIAAHTGQAPVSYEFITSSRLQDATIVADQTWQDVDGVSTSVGFFVSNPADAVGKLIFAVRVSGTGASIRSVFASDDSVLMTEQLIPDTLGEYVIYSLYNNGPFKLEQDIIKVQARLNGAASMDTKFASITLLKKV